MCVRLNERPFFTLGIAYIQVIVGVHILLLHALCYLLIVRLHNSCREAMLLYIDQSQASQTDVMYDYFARVGPHVQDIVISRCIWRIL